MSHFRAKQLWFRRVTRDTLLLLAAVGAPISCKDNVERAENLQPSRKGDRWGYTDRSGEFVIKPKFEACGPFLSGMAPVRSQSKWGFIGARGNFVISPRYDDVTLFFSGLCGVRLGDRFGFMDRRGNIEIPITLEDITRYGFGGGLAAELAPVKKSGLWGFVDRRGAVVIGHQFQEVFPPRGSVTDGIAGVKKDGRWGLIDANGSTVLEYEWDMVVPNGPYERGRSERTIVAFANLGGGWQDGRFSGGQWYWLWEWRNEMKVAEGWLPSGEAVGWLSVSPDTWHMRARGYFEERETPLHQELKPEERGYESGEFELPTGEGS